MKTKFFYLIALAAITLTACEQNEPAVTVDNIADTEIIINANMADITPQNAPRRAPNATNAGHDPGALTVGEMGFFLTTEGTDRNAKYNAINKKLVYQDGKWVPEDGTPLYWKNQTTNVDYIAYHPYDVMADNGMITIQVPQVQTADNVVDFLYAKGSTTGNISRGSIDLAMKHAMSKLTVTLRPGTELETTQFKQVVLKDMAKGAVFDLEEGTRWNSLSANPIIDITMIQNDNLNYEAIVIPQEFKDNAFVVEITTVDNRLFRFTQQNVQLQMSCAYTLNIIIGKDKVELEPQGISASDWELPDNWNGNLKTE